MTEGAGVTEGGLYTVPMLLNRWTILAVVLLLSTAIGLTFRPWGDGPSGLRTVEDGSLSLSCPDAYTAASGDRFTIECGATDTSAPRDDDLVSAWVRTYPEDTVRERGWSFDEVSPNVFELIIDARATRDGLVQAQLEKKVPLEFDPDVVDERFLALTRKPVRPVSTPTLDVAVHVRQNLLFYSGFGLSIFMLVLLVLISAGFLPYRLLRRTVGFATHDPSQMAYSTARALWSMYYALWALLLLSYIGHIFTIERLEGLTLVEVVFVILLYLFLLLILWLVHGLTFRNATPLGPNRNDPSDLNDRTSNAVPFIGALVTGFVVVPLAFLIISQWVL